MACSSQQTFRHGRLVVSFWLKYHSLNPIKTWLITHELKTQTNGTTHLWADGRAWLTFENASFATRSQCLVFEGWIHFRTNWQLQESEKQKPRTLKTRDKASNISVQTFVLYFANRTTIWLHEQSWQGIPAKTQEFYWKYKTVKKISQWREWITVMNEW